MRTQGGQVQDYLATLGCGCLGPGLRSEVHMCLIRELPCSLVVGSTASVHHSKLLPLRFKLQTSLKPLGSLWLCGTASNSLEREGLRREGLLMQDWAVLCPMLGCRTAPQVLADQAGGQMGTRGKACTTCTPVLPGHCYLARPLAER